MWIYQPTQALGRSSSGLYGLYLLLDDTCDARPDLLEFLRPLPGPGARLRLSAGLPAVRLDPDPPVRAWRHTQDRLWQHWHDQCLKNRPQRLGRTDSSSRRWQGCGRRADRRRLGPGHTALAAGLGALFGHLYPVWLRFKGGKGVATALGILLAVAWPVGIAACLTWLAVAAIFRYSSLSSLTALASSPLFAWWLIGDHQVVELAAILAAFIWARHIPNIRRLLSGEESKIGRDKAKGADPPSSEKA